MSRVATQQQQPPKPIRFSTIEGQVHTIALKYAGPGKRCTAPRSGDQQIYFTLSDGRPAYFPVEVGEEIESLHLGANEPFTVLKNGATWDVQRVHTPAPIPPQPSATRNGPVPQTAQSPVNGAGETSAMILARCYREAVDIALGAVQYAESKGLRITPAFEDIRALAATMCINETGGRR